MSRRWVLLVAAMLAAVALLAGVGYLNWPRRQAPPPGPPVVDLTGTDRLVARAVEAARATVESRPESADAWGRLGMVLFAHDFHAEALVCLERAEQLDQRDPRWPYFQGLILVTERPVEALAPLGRAADVAGRESTPRLRLAEVLFGLDRLDEAQEQLHLLWGVGDHPRGLLIQGLIAKRRGDLNGCLPLLERAATSPHARRTARSALAEVHQELAHAEIADRLQAEVARLPKDPPWPDPLLAQVVELQTGTRARLNQINVLMNSGRTQEAIALSRRTVDDDPGSDMARLALGRALLQARDYRAAEEALAEAARRRPDLVDAHLLRGGALGALAQYGEAAKCYQRVIELNPAHALAHYQLADSLRHSGDRPGAHKALRDAIRCKPDMIHAHIALAELLLEDNDPHAAIAALRDALNLNPEDEKAKKLLAEAEAKLKK